MKAHDYNATLGLALVTDDDGSRWRYAGAAGSPPLEDTPMHILRQGHYVANAIPRGLVIVGERIPLRPAQWTRGAGRLDLNGNPPKESTP